MSLSFTLTVANGWSNLGTLLTAANYTGRRLMASLIVSNTDTADTITVHRDSLAAPVSDVGVHLSPGDSLAVVSEFNMPIDVSRVWLKSSDVTSSAIDVDLVPRS